MPVSIKVKATEIELGIPPSECIPSYMHPTRKQNFYVCSIRYIVEVLSAYRGIMNADEIHNEYIKQMYIDELARRDASDLLKNADNDAIVDIARNKFNNTTGLWPHQLRGVLLAAVNRRYCFFYDTRTGKTRMAYQIMLNYIRAHQGKKCIVFVKSSIIPDWLSDAKMFPDLKVAAYYSDPYTKMQALAEDVDILLFSIEQTVKNAELLATRQFDICFFDESSCLKSHRSQISKFMVKYAKTVAYFYMLSATPAPNGFHEYYMQMQCIDSTVFPSARTNFLREYFNNISRNPNFEKLVIKPERKSEFISLIEDYALYVDQSIMPTAGKTYTINKFKHSESTMEYYNKMKQSMSTEIHNKEFTVDMATSVRAKLQQISSGFIIDTDAKTANQINKALSLGEPVRREIYPIPEAVQDKVNCLSDIIQQYADEELFVIWANYRAEFDILENYCLINNYTFATLNGETPLVMKEQIVRDFKAGKIKCLLCHPLSVGMGKNFTEAHIAIYYSLNDSWEAFKQSSERIAGHLAVQPKECIYHVMLAEGTINEIVYDNLINKREQSYGVLEHLKSKGDTSG